MVDPGSGDGQDPLELAVTVERGRARALIAPEVADVVRIGEPAVVIGVHPLGEQHEDAGPAGDSDGVRRLETCPVEHEDAARDSGGEGARGGGAAVVGHVRLGEPSGGGVEVQVDELLVREGATLVGLHRSAVRVERGDLVQPHPAEERERLRDGCGWTRAHFLRVVMPAQPEPVVTCFA